MKFNSKISLNKTKYSVPVKYSNRQRKKPLNKIILKKGNVIKKNHKH